MKITFTVPKSAVTGNYQKVLKTAAKSVTIKGFRKGKAPLKMVEERLGKQELEKQSLEETLPSFYLKSLEKSKLQPVSYPDIKLSTVEKNGDWTFEAEVPTKPDIKLGDYKQALKAAAFKAKTANPKIWLPGEEAKSDSTKDHDHNHDHTSEDQQLKLIFDTLLQTVKLEVPQILIDRERSRSLSKLLAQIEKLGLNLDEYLKSIGKTHDQLKAEYEQTAKESLKLEFILQEIASAEKIDVSDQEINQIIATIPDAKQKEQFADPDSKLNLKLVILKRKTIDRLSAYTH